MKELRSQAIFWPILLIAVGVIWLLANLNIIPAFNFGLLLNLWPLLLIVGGANLIIGRRMPLLRAFITLAAIGLAILYVLFAPQLGLVVTPEVKEASLSEPLGETTSARINIDSSVGQTHIKALVDSSALFEAELTYVGDLTYDVVGTDDKTVNIGVDDDSLNTRLYNFIDENQLRWEIGLTQNIPLLVDFSGGVGEIVMDLSGLTLTEVYVNGGVGEVEITLPAQEGLYSVFIDGGVGSFLVILQDGAEVELDINSGVGEVVIDIPEEAGVELRADTGVGNIRLPSRFNEAGKIERGVGASGIWETQNISTANYVIYIDYNGGVGDFRIR